MGEANEDCPYHDNARWCAECLHRDHMQDKATIATLKSELAAAKRALKMAGELALCDNWDTRHPLVFGEMEKTMEALLAEQTQ
jgi:hypothetical protein